jgi:hypothetical protein
MHMKQSTIKMIIRLNPTTGNDPPLMTSVKPQQDCLLFLYL